MQIICANGHLSHSEPFSKKLNVLKIDGMIEKLLQFSFDLININLPTYSITYLNFYNQ